VLLKETRDVAISVAMIVNLVVFGCQQMLHVIFCLGGIEMQDLHSAAAMSDKRKVPEGWVDATVVEEEGRRGAYLAEFSGVLPPDSTMFREYKRQRTGNEKPKDVILQGETERIEFEGRTRGDDDIDTCQYPLALYG
jgi:A49-like RNA polymerase I associated factor